ncbi:MAG: sigma-54-dependent Fis family transcriptional regulator [Planctomycetaceae bacterium]|nr:sigma-54-dependent Fis family transcriptional regulator [Planctomycetales bacterium]MCB9921664.1 sigma-54-dependent Fis family transcriptional regulator [Planctomycetaceae bacterium]
MHKSDKLTLLVVDDDDRFRGTLVDRFRRRGFEVYDAGNIDAAWSLAQRCDFDVAVIDMVMPGGSGLELLKLLKGSELDCEVIMLTGQASIDSAVSAMKLGAFDYLTKPFPLADVEKLIEKAKRQHELSKENRQLKSILLRNRPSREIVGESPAMREIYRLIERAGPSDKPILIQGESGTGKELVAWALHECSSRAEKPMVVINCAALPEALLESELFGHEKGAFTGADKAKPGLFEVADGGTIFIDEIGEMPPSVQVKLLRVLEDGSLRRVGSLREHRVHARLLAATNRDLERQVSYGQFREDLFYRINLMSLELPPLRERSGDISLLVRHFLKDGWEIEDTAMQLLEGYHWPGNVRQLINVIERAQILADDQLIRTIDLPRQVVKDTQFDRPIAFQKTDELATLERAKVLEVLRREEGNKTRTAKVLGIERRKLYRLLDKYNIHEDELVARSH